MLQMMKELDIQQLQELIQIRGKETDTVVAAAEKVIVRTTLVLTLVTILAIMTITHHK